MNNEDFKREPYLLHVKDTLVDFEKEQANECRYKAALEPAKWKGINISCKTCFPIHYKYV